MEQISGFQNIFDPTWVTDFSEIKNHLKTGDVILVHGRYPFSWVVTLLQGSHWGHVAMVVLAKDVDPENKLGLPELLLWEANTYITESAENLWGKDAGEIKEGAMLVSLEKRLQHTQSNFDNVLIAHRPLSYALDIDHLLLSGIFDEFIDRKFPSNREIIYSVYLGRKYNRVSENPELELDLDINFISGEVKSVSVNAYHLKSALSSIDIVKDKIYCSELLAATYKRLGILTNNHVSNAYAPKDFSSEGKVRLLRGLQLGDEMFIDM